MTEPSKPDDDQVRAALEALGIPVVPDQLPGYHDDQLRPIALLHLLGSQVSAQIFENLTPLLEAGVPAEDLTPFTTDALGAGPDLDQLRHHALDRLSELKRQAYLLALHGTGAATVPETEGFSDAHALAVLHSAHLSQLLLANLGTDWQDKDLAAESGQVQAHLDRAAEAVAAVLAHYRHAAEGRRKRQHAVDYQPGIAVPWTTRPVLAVPETAQADPDRTRALVQARTDRTVAWARADPAIAAVTVTVVAIGQEYLAVYEDEGRWRYSWASERRSTGLSAGVAAVEAATAAHWNWQQTEPLWTSAGGEANLLDMLPPQAVGEGAYTRQ